ncbi:MAG: response regulator transcription factor [Bacteroidetes bacterium]|nr:response regulator transcription factor [Bacteroidota bacterium]
METKLSILLVEDDPNLSNVLKDYLEMTGYNVNHAADGALGLSYFKKYKVDLCILDVMLPKKDGFTLAREIREQNAQVPIIFLTARGLMEDRVTGFKAGCDDYITKPFSSEELSLRIEAIMRRCGVNQSEEKEMIQIGNYLFDVANFELIHKQVRHSLTPKEAAILRVLCKHKNTLLTREKALKEVWGDDDYFIGRSMDVFITKLRKYLKDDPNVAIMNVHGTGFRLEVNE